MPVPVACGTPVVAVTFDARKFFPCAVLAPSHGRAAGTDEDPMRAPMLHQSPLLLPISRRAFPASGEPLAFGERTGPVKIHAPAVVPAVTPSEEPFKIPPGCKRELPGCVSRSRYRNGKASHFLVRSQNSLFAHPRHQMGCCLVLILPSRRPSASPSDQSSKRFKQSVRRFRGLMRCVSFYRSLALFPLPKGLDHVILEGDTGKRTTEMLHPIQLALPARLSMMRPSCTLSTTAS